MIRFRFALLASLLVAAFALTFVGTTAKRVVHAQSQDGDTWSRSDERLATVSATISTSGGAAVVSAVTGKLVNVRAITFRSDTTGVVTFLDGASGSTIANYYMVANKPYTFYEGLFGPGLKTTRGNGLYAYLSGATLTATVRYRAE